MNIEFLYLIMVGVLFLLAISDLVVGVSNDAVNFLNSAIGSKAAPFYITMIIASLGILIGACFSSGMMEVARSGIFHPQQFYFNEVMLIFLAVMITDVVLLDLFNTFGMPTSTTVSLVFELLGAAVAISLVKIYQHPVHGFSDLALYINTSKASAIVFSILASVFVGFIVGAVVQYLARLLFSFKYTKTIRYFGSIWGGICFCLITYFIIFKGMKGSALISPSLIEYLSANVGIFMFCVFAVSALLMEAISILFKFNPLRIVVLFGTFALAMAFAGNDLVNFIGVPMAGLSAFQLFSAQDLAPDLMGMAAMQGKVPTHVTILIMAGIIMILTLWFSKRAKRVIKTTVNLSSQSSEDERFTSTPLSRSIVRMCVGLSEVVQRYTPKPLARAIAGRFKQEKRLKMKGDALAFDLVRASVNLMVASTLIAFGTSLKLPLSTTYITFMVAMGSSLSDGAWGRENAVYRVTGVFTVIGGWFVTAIVAFTVACAVAFIIYFGSWIAIIGILGLLTFTVIRTHTLAKRKDKIQENETPYLAGKVEAKDIHQAISDDIRQVLDQMPKIYELTIEGLDDESLKTLRKAQKEYEALDKHTKNMKNKVNETIKIIQKCSFANGHFYIQVVNYLRESLHSLSFVVDSALEHTNNKHKALLKDQINELRQSTAGLEELYQHLNYMLAQRNYTQVEELNLEQQNLTELLDSFNKKQMKRVKNGVSGTKNSLLFLRIISNTKNMILFTYLLSKSLRDFEAAKNYESETE